MSATPTPSLDVLLGYGLTKDEYRPWVEEVIDKSIRSLISRLTTLLDAGVPVSTAIATLRSEGNENGLTDDYGDVMVDAFLSACASLLMHPLGEDS